MLGVSCFARAERRRCGRWVDRARATWSVFRARVRERAIEVAAGDIGRARARIAELERKIGQQQVELDFFRQALRQVKGARRPSDGPGVTGSTRSSRR